MAAIMHLEACPTDIEADQKSAPVHLFCKDFVMKTFLWIFFPIRRLKKRIYVIKCALSKDILPLEDWSWSCVIRTAGHPDITSFVIVHVKHQNKLPNTL